MTLDDQVQTVNITGAAVSAVLDDAPTRPANAQSGRPPFLGRVTLAAPYPPSANRLWRAVKGRNIESAEYRGWKKVADRELTGQWADNPTIQGRYALTIIASRPDNRRRDLGNLEKPLSDALVAAKIVADDCKARTIRLAWTDEIVRGGAITLHIEECD